MKKSLFFFLSLSLFFASCGGSSEEAEQAEETTTEESAPAAAAPSNEAMLAITGGDDMKYDLTELKATEGQTVKLTLTHSGKMPKESMGHNWVLLAASTDVDAFAKEAINAKDNDYIPAALASSVIAHTKTIGGGETTDVTFTAPAKGTYDFICTFPGHYAMMRGKLIVE